MTNFLELIRNWRSFSDLMVSFLLISRVTTFLLSGLKLRRNYLSNLVLIVGLCMF